MTDTCHIAELSAIRTDLLQDELPDVFAREPYHWRSSWWERVLMIVIPVVLFAVHGKSSGDRPSKYSAMKDDVFYSSIGFRHGGVFGFIQPERYFLGMVVSSPQPLLSYQALIAQTKKTHPRATGLRFMDSEIMCYPESLMTMAGCSDLEVVIYEILVRALLVGWTLLGIANIIRFARYRRWLRNYKLFG